MFDGGQKPLLGLLAGDGGADDGGEGVQEEGVAGVELALVWTVDLQHAPRFAVQFGPDQDVDGTPHAVVGQKFGRVEALFVLQMVGDQRLAGLEGVAGRRIQFDAQRGVTLDLAAPAHASDQDQPVAAFIVDQHLGQGRLQAVGADHAGGVEQGLTIAFAQGHLAETRQQRLLLQAIAQLVGDGTGLGRRRILDLGRDGIVHLDLGLGGRVGPHLGDQFGDLRGQAGVGGRAGVGQGRKSRFARRRHIG